MGNSAYLSLFLTTSGWILSCFLAAFDIGKSDLAFQPWRISIGDFVIPVIGVLWCIIKTLVEIFAFLFGFVEQAFHTLDIFLSKTI